MLDLVEHPGDLVRFEREDYDVDGPDVGTDIGAARSDREVAARALDLHAVLTQRFEVGSAGD
jgi:hypothetical protein